MVENVESILRNLGLTEYEIKAWLTLIRNGNLTAERISELGSIPLPRVYDTITELQKKGFVLVTKTRPKVFKSLTPEISLKHFLEFKENEFKKKMDEMKKDADSISKHVSKIQPKTPEVSHATNMWFIEKKENITRFIEDQEKMAKKTMLSFSGDLSWVDGAEGVLKKAIKRGVVIKILMHKPQSQIIEKRIEKARKIGIHVKIGYDGLLRGQLVDDKTAYLETRYTKKGINVPEDNPEGAKYEVIILDNPCLIDAIRQYFEFWWKKLS